MLSVKSFVNTPVPSNCYVLFNKDYGADCVIVDPGTKNNQELGAFLSKEALVPKYIILTHEHFDHCWGVNALVKRYSSPVICSKLCSEAIKYEKRNCSVFYENNEGFAIDCKTISIESIGEVLAVAGDEIRFFRTPGHSDASICFMVGHLLFTGDTLIKDERTVTKLPTGSIERLKESIGVIKQLRGKGLTVCPGHGAGFALDEYELSKCWEG